MNTKFFTMIAIVLALSVSAHAQAPSGIPPGEPSPAAKPTPTPRQPPAISIFRVRADNPGHGSYSRGRIGFGNPGFPYDRVTGTVWFANDTTDTLTDVVMTIDFYNTRWYRSDGSKDYPIGTLDPRQTMSVNYRWDNWQGSYVVPRVRIVYRKPGDSQLHSVYSNDYGY